MGEKYGKLGRDRLLRTLNSVVKNVDVIRQVLKKDFGVVFFLITYLVLKFEIGKNLVGLTQIFSTQCQMQQIGSGTCTRLASWC